MNDNSSDDTWTTLAVAGLAVLAANALSGLFQADKGKAKKLFDRSLELQQAGRLPEAINLLLQSIQKDNTYAPAFNNLAWLIALRKDLHGIQAAEQYALRALQYADGPADRASFLDTLGEVYMVQGRLDDAIQQFQESLRVNPELDAAASEYGPSFRLAICYFQKQEMLKAHSAVIRAVQAGSANPFVYNLLGLINLELQRFNDAVQSFREAIRLTPAWTFHIPLPPPMPLEEWRQLTLSNFYCGLGMAYYRLEKIEAYREANQEAIDAYPANPTPLINLASLSAREEAVAEMRAYLEDGLRLMVRPQHDFLIQYMLTEPNFESARDVVYEMLLTHNFISLSHYKDLLKNWHNNNLRALQASSSQIINVNNSNGVAIGDQNSLSGVSIDALR